MYPPAGGKFLKGILSMAQYEHLPIYRKAMEMAVYFEKIVRNFSRYNKYTLGSDFREMSRDILRLIIKANSSREKLPILYGRSKGLRLQE